MMRKIEIPKTGTLKDVHLQSEQDFADYGIDNDWVGSSEEEFDEGWYPMDGDKYAPRNIGFPFMDEGPIKCYAIIVDTKFRKHVSPGPITADGWGDVVYKCRKQAEDVLKVVTENEQGYRELTITEMVIESEYAQSLGFSIVNTIEEDELRKKRLHSFGDIYREITLDLAAKMGLDEKSINYINRHIDQVYTDAKKSFWECHTFLRQSYHEMRGYDEFKDIKTEIEVLKYSINKIRKGERKMWYERSTDLILEIRYINYNPMATIRDFQREWERMQDSLIKTLSKENT